MINPTAGVYFPPPPSLSVYTTEPCPGCGVDCTWFYRFPAYGRPVPAPEISCLNPACHPAHVLLALPTPPKVNSEHIIRSSN